MKTVLRGANRLSRSRWTSPRGVASVLLWAWAAWAAAAPAVLIVQLTTPVRYGKNFDVSVASELAQGLDDEGQVLPIVWSLTDPIYRAAVDDKTIPNPKNNPSPAEAQACALKLKADYVLFVKAVRDHNAVESEAKLYKADKLVWVSDKEKLSIRTDSGMDADATATSLAHTLVVKLTTTAFKGFPSKRRVTPPMDPGQASNTLTPELPRKVDDKLLAENVAALAKDGQNSRALALLRDSVDAAPFDAGRRRLLIEFLMTHGETGTAASEAQRAALLMPESGEFHVMAARALMQGGDSAQAQIELNEAVARDPESFETRLLLGELCLMKLDVANAIEHFNKALEKDSTPQALFERALAGALEGNKEAAAKDMADALKGGEDAQQVQIRYALMRNLADRALTDFGSRCSELVRKARLQPTAPDVLAGSKQLAATCDGIKQLVDLPTKPAANAASHDQLVLALNLLAQSLSQIDESLKDKDSDALADATATLGQALKQAAAARDAYKAELQKPAD